MAKKRTFISFDYDHDARLKDLLVGQAKNSGSPFEIADYSIKSASPDWKAKAQTRIKGCDLVIVLCGKYTDTATGVSEEMRIAQAQGVPYFLLGGYADAICKKPSSAKSTDKVYNWTWDNLKILIMGGR